MIYLTQHQHDMRGDHVLVLGRIRLEFID